MIFNTIYYPSENVHLKKDVGQIPFMFYKLYGYSSSLITYFNSSDKHSQFPLDVNEHYPFINNDVKGLNLYFLKRKKRGKFYEKTVVNYLFKNASKIDILHLFHFTVETILYGIIYKTINPRGILYVKLDIDINYYQSREHFINTNTYFSNLKILFFNKVILPWFKKSVNLFSAETQSGLDFFKSRFQIRADKIIKIRNGIDRDMLKKYIPQLNNYSQKENIMICVGTLGLKQKNHSFLFSALCNVNLQDWKIYCIGKIEKTFTKEINAFFHKNPEKKSQVILTGEITDNKVLYDLYNRSKIVCQVSEWEGFSISTCEALYFGNYPILTDTIGSLQELTNNYEFGQTVELNNNTQLTSILQDLINNPQKIENDFESIISFSHKHLIWQEIIPILNRKLLC